MEKWKSIFSYPLGERAWGGREGAGAVRLQGESSLPAESEKMHLGPFSPLSGMAPQLRGLGGVARDRACGKQEGRSAPGWVSWPSAQAHQGRCWGRGGGPSLPPGPPWAAPASTQRPLPSYCLLPPPAQARTWGQTTGGPGGGRQPASQPAWWVGALFLMELSWDLPSGASGGTGEGQGARSHKWTKSKDLVDKVIVLGLSSFVMRSSWHCLKIRPFLPPGIWLSGSPGPASVPTTGAQVWLPTARQASVLRFGQGPCWRSGTCFPAHGDCWPRETLGV